MPMALPSLLMQKDVPIYVTVNAGLIYKIGYIAGINACGFVVFGLSFWKPQRRAKSLMRFIRLKIADDAFLVKTDKDCFDGWLFSSVSSTKSGKAAHALPGPHFSACFAALFEIIKCAWTKRLAIGFAKDV